MAIELRRLIEKVEHMDITLLAGEHGTGHLVQWVHMTETVEASGFLDGGEIAFVTGIGLSSPAGLLNLVEKIYQRNAAGIIVNTGPFLETVHKDVLAFCDQHDFPLYVVPWKIHLAEIMRIFCTCITRESQRSLETAAAFKNAIFFPQQEELYVVPLSTRCFHVNWRYAACVLQITTEGDLLQRNEKMIVSLENSLRHAYKNFAVFEYEGEIILVVANYDRMQMEQFVEALKQYSRKYLLRGEEISLGVGRQTRSIRCLYKSYRQAKSIQRLQMRHKIEPTMIFYSDMGLYRLLMGIEDKEFIQDYYDATLRRILEYDKANGADLTDVLRCYLNHDGSVKDTADALFVHRNTVNYKIGKIGELLHKDLSSLQVRMELLLAFMLQDML